VRQCKDAAVCGTVQWCDCAAVCGSAREEDPIQKAVVCVDHPSGSPSLIVINESTRRRLRSKRGSRDGARCATYTNNFNNQRGGGRKCRRNSGGWEVAVLRIGTSPHTIINNYQSTGRSKSEGI
jgi:hypothetical protein